MTLYIPEIRGGTGESDMYESPEIREIGTVRDLTLQSFNKVGPESDQFTTITNGVVVGSLVFSP